MNTDRQEFELTRLLADWCGDRSLGYPASAVERAERAIADTVGCMLMGAEDAATAAAGRIVPDMTSGRSSSVRHAFPVPATWAAMVNGCAAHALDFDDNFFPAITHASAALVPALFALAEETGAKPSAVVHAYIAGLEVEAQIGKLVNPSHYASGWHATSTIGAIGTAAACAVLMQLDSDGILHAMSIASSLAGGTKKQFGSMVKPLHAGFAAMHGVMSAQLAQAGMKGNESVLQGKWSFHALFAGEAGKDEGFVPMLFPDAPLAIDAAPPVAKLYPSCGSSHLGIDGILALRAAYALAPGDVAGIDIHLPAAMVGNLRYAQPQDEMQARFSMNYCAALALLHGVPRLSHFTREAVGDPDITALLPLVRMHVRDPSEQSMRLPFGGDCLVRLQTRSGVQLEHRAQYPKGCGQNPLTEAEQRDKFIDCASARLGNEEAERAYDKLRKFSRVSSPDEVAGLLRRRVA